MAKPERTKAPRSGGQVERTGVSVFTRPAYLVGFTLMALIAGGLYIADGRRQAAAERQARDCMLAALQDRMFPGHYLDFYALRLRDRCGMLKDLPKPPGT